LGRGWSKKESRREDRWGSDVRWGVGEKKGGRGNVCIKSVRKNPGEEGQGRVGGKKDHKKEKRIVRRPQRKAPSQGENKGRPQKKKQGGRIKKIEEGRAKKL